MTAPIEPKPRAARAAAFLVEQAMRFDKSLAEAEPRVLTNADTEAVHDLRVALRRLRTLLKLARPVFGGFHADAVRQAFSTLASSTGELRDEEVLESTLDGLGLPDVQLAAWCGRRRVRERRLRRGVVTRLRQGELLRARTLLHALMTLPVRPDRDPGLGKFARRVVQKAQRGVEARRDAGEDDVVALHDLRIAFKHLRYAVEIFAPALPADLAALAEPAARFQKRLGDLHDLDVAVVVLGKARGLDAGMRALTVAALGEVRARKIAKYLGEMNPVAAVVEGEAGGVGG
jgi:CHAD domain-containing protein